MDQELLILLPDQSLTFSSADHIKHKMLKYAIQNTSTFVIVDGRYVRNIDATVAKVNFWTVDQIQCETNCNKNSIQSPVVMYNCGWFACAQEEGVLLALEQGADGCFMSTGFQNVYTISWCTIWRRTAEIGEHREWHPWKLYTNTGRCIEIISKDKCCRWWWRWRW